jgi:hypothetical protein
MASLFGITHSFSFILEIVWKKSGRTLYIYLLFTLSTWEIIILADTRYTIKTISLTHVGCTRGQRIFTIPMQSFVGQELNNITRSGCKWKYARRYRDDEGSAFTGRLAEATHLFQQTSLRGLYRIFFVPTDGLVHKLKMAIYFNYSQNEGDLMLIGVGNHVTRCSRALWTRPVSALRYQIFTCSEI